MYCPCYIRVCTVCVCIYMFVFDFSIMTRPQEIILKEVNLPGYAKCVSGLLEDSYIFNVMSIDLNSSALNTSIILLHLPPSQ